jgi:hypothetical protein
MQRSKYPSYITRIVILLLLTVIFTPATFAQKKPGNKQAEKPAAQKIILADNETSGYTIVIPTHATAEEQKAANVLQDYLLQISGAALPILAADKHKSAYEIVLGQNERLDELAAGINYALLKEDGFLIRTDSMRLIIAGGNEKGTLYGVYSFLEKYLGCRMLTPKVKLIPRRKQVTLDKINDLQVPVIAFRDTHYRSTWDEEYTEWHKLDHDATAPELIGGCGYILLMSWCRQNFLPVTPRIFCDGERQKTAHAIMSFQPGRA